jgi:pimeloyl-ACP methyl ester carboxylesterase
VAPVPAAGLSEPVDSAPGNYPNAELEVLPSAGNYPMFEAPAALAASIEEFLGRG